MSDLPSLFSDELSSFPGLDEAELMQSLLNPVDTVEEEAGEHFANHSHTSHSPLAGQITSQSQANGQSHTESESDDLAQQKRILNNPLFPFVLRAVNDTDGVLLPYVPPASTWLNDSTCLADQEATRFLVSLLRVMEQQARQSTALLNTVRQYKKQVQPHLPRNRPVAINQTQAQKHLRQLRRQQRASEKNKGNENESLGTQPSNCTTIDENGEMRPDLPFHVIDALKREDDKRRARAKKKRMPGV
ncbi:MAG: hypothetical protein MHM6MM_004444 [Cercozoa sp. M6MM]